MTSLIVIVLAFVAGVYATNTTTQNPYANKTVCYDHVGCFNNLPPFDNAAFDLPRSPEEIGTEFLLFTRGNPSSPDRLSYVSQTSISSSHYRGNTPTKIIIHGFANTVKTRWLYTMKDAFLAKGEFNVIIVAWGNGAKAPDYNQAVSNTRMVATQTRLLVQRLFHASGSLRNIHIIGHSLGAHTAGSTGRQLRGNLGRITGLDPAEPDFENHPEGVRIDPTDAFFVDIIHTNGAPIRRGGAGLMQVSGHVDFYVNGGERQPGCPDLVSGAVEQLFTRNVSGAVLAASCSHGRSHEYFTESILTNCPFNAYPCESYEKFSAGGCRVCGVAGCSQLGLNADQNNGRGKMFLNTQSAQPFCGYQYVVSTVYGTHDSVGQLLLTVDGSGGRGQQIPITKVGEHIRAGLPHSQIVAMPSRFPDVNAITVLYKKKSGFLFGWGGGRNDVTLTSITIQEIRANTKGIDLPDGVPVSITQRSATGVC